METSVRVFSKEMSPSGNKDPFTISVEESLWQLRFREDNTEGRFFLRIFNEDGTKEWIAPAGDVVLKHMLNEDELRDEHHNIYLPLWMLDSAGLEGSGEVLKCSILSNDAFPEATKIVLRFIDSAFYNSDLKSELEQSLTQLGVLRKHSTIQIPVRSLGNFPVEVFVSDLEPADYVLCDGDEVVVDFEQPVDSYEPVQRPPTPVPAVLPILQEETVPQQEEHPVVQGFVPFRGEGRVLGGSNACIPEWRRNLPPRRP